MDIAAIPDEGCIGDSEKRRENRLTSIIDQLLSNKGTRNFDEKVAKSDKKVKGKYRREPSTVAVKGNESVVSASVTSLLDRQVQASTPDNSKSENGISEKISVRTPLSNKARRKKISRNSTLTSGVKLERSSPDLEAGTGSSRSASPYSPNSNSNRTRTPSNIAPPSNSYFSPTDRFSPANNSAHSKLMSEGLHMSRNYSDFMRSLAAKYNNSNPNDYRTNNLISLLDSRSACKELVSGEGSSQAFPLLNLPLSSFTSGAASLASKKHFELAFTGGNKKERKEDFPTISPLCGLAQDPNTHQSSTLGFPSNPAMDMSSTQTLLNIVRSASARAQQLDSYFGGAPVSNVPVSLKRSIEVTGLQTPLDLSASMVKRPYIESQSESIAANRLGERTALRSPVNELDSIVKESHYYPTSRPSSRFMTDIIAACYTNAQKEKKETVSNKVAATQLPATCRLNCAAQHTCSPAAAEVREWSIAHVVEFVKGIDLCTEYAQVFEEHSIDGSTLPLLTEEHLTTNLNMKLGPALKLKSVLAKKIGHCAVCLHCVHCHGDTAARASPLSTSQNPQNSSQDSTNTERESPADYK